MHINKLPFEILSSILEETAKLNVENGATYTYGLSEAPVGLQKVQLSRHVRGPVSPDALRFDSTRAIRNVSTRWRAWALQYALQDVYIRRWRGSERWAELSTKRKLYNIYELIEKPSGYAVYREPYGSLRHTAVLFSQQPIITENIRRLWFGGFFTAETDRLIFQVLRRCRQLEAITVPWTLLRHGTAEDWMHLLGITSQTVLPLRSLELQAICLSEAKMKDPANQVDLQALSDPRVDFSHLRRLKIHGNTTFAPVSDTDLATIARSASCLEEFHITSLSTVSIQGAMAIVKASQATLRVLEHSPRSDDGFFHPDPGQLEPGEHACSVLTNCVKLKDLSISIPSMCADLFSNEDVRWSGECQVRARSLCSHDHDISSSPNSSSAINTRRPRDDISKLRLLLDQARNLIATRPQQRRELDIELFFADCIFDPRDCVVHGDFALAQISSGGCWPATKTHSSKGPYGSTGLYGKDEGNWDIVSEDEYLYAVERGWISLA